MYKSSYEDLTRAASIAKQAVDKNLVTKSDFGINPGSEQVSILLKETVSLKFLKILMQLFLQMHVAHV